MISIFWTLSTSFKNWLPALQCHRGYWIEGLPENTLVSIQKAIELGYEMVELDVRLTADSQVVLFHDSHLNKKALERMTLDEIRSQIDVNTLDQVLSWLSSLKNKKNKLNIELKTNSVLKALLEFKVVSLIHKYEVADQILVSSFNPLALARIYFLDSKIYRALLLTYESSSENKWYLKKRLFLIFCRPHALHLWEKDWPQWILKKSLFKIPVVLWTYNGDCKNLDPRIHGVISDQITPEQFKFRV